MQEPEDFEFGSSHPPTVLGRAGTGRGWWWLLAVVLVFAAGAGYLYYDRQLAEKLLKGTPLELPPRITTVYKWQDEHGNWQITGRPPAGDTPYEILEYASDTNVMPLVSREED